jgi:hypothetical protein
VHEIGIEQLAANQCRVAARGVSGDGEMAGAKNPSVMPDELDDRGEVARPVTDTVMVPSVERIAQKDATPTQPLGRVVELETQGRGAATAAERDDQSTRVAAALPPSKPARPDKAAQPDPTTDVAGLLATSVAGEEDPGAALDTMFSPSAPASAAPTTGRDRAATRGDGRRRK